MLSRKYAPLLKFSRRLRRVNAYGEKMAIKKLNGTDPKEPDRVVPGLGEKLRTAREAEGMSIRELAAKSGVNIARISRLENDRANLRLPHFLDLLAALKLSAGEALDPDLDEKSRFLQIARRVRGLIGVSELEWLSQLDKLEAKLALQRAHEGVEYHRKQLERPAEETPVPHTIRGMKRGDPF